MGGYKVQGRTVAAAEALVADALAMEAAGAALVVLEGIPREVAQTITAQLRIPTLGIGAGPDCDGQILVLHDILGLTFAAEAKFVRRYADLGGQMHQAIASYAADVREGRFPSDQESYHLSSEAIASFLPASPGSNDGEEATIDIEKDLPQPVGSAGIF